MANRAKTIEQIRSEVYGKQQTFQNFAFRVDREADVDVDARTVKLAFASDKPIDNWYWGAIKLQMNKKNIRTGRLDSGAPLLMDHDTRDVVGVVEGYSFDSDGIARATVRFGESARAREVFEDVRTGIRQNVSVGFMIHELNLESNKKDEVAVYRADDWEPYEISIVAVPADTSVGVGRSLEDEPDTDDEQVPTPKQTRAISTQEENKMTPEEIAAKEAADQQRALELADTRRKDVLAFADIYGERDMAADLLLANPEATQDDIRQAIKAKRDALPKAPAVPAEDPSDVARRNGVVEFARTLPRYGTLRAFKGEDAAERAFKFGQFVLAGPLGNAKAREFCLSNGIQVTRAQSEGLNEKGGYFVPEDFGNDLIDLIEQYGVFRSHAKIRPMTRDTASDPRIVGELDAYFVGESSTGTESDFETDRVNLTAKKLMTLVTFSSELSEDAVISIGDQVALMSARAFAKKEDECGFNGDGSATYGGIVGVREKIKNLSATIANIAGLQVGTGNLYSELVLADFRGVVAKLPEYADNGAAWYCSRSFYWNVMVAALLAGGGVTATEIENARNQQFLGYPVYFSQVMPKTEANSQVCALFGDLAMGATLGDRRQYSIALSEHARFTADDIVFKATSRFDINVHSVGNASATAADRVPGPIVGLITAAS